MFHFGFNGNKINFQSKAKVFCQYIKMAVCICIVYNALYIFRIAQTTAAFGGSMKHQTKLAMTAFAKRHNGTALRKEKK
jgi:hypothetical protein